MRPFFSWMARAGLLLLLLVPALAHICILDPPQRGGLDVSDPGDNSCYRRTDYCGGVPAAAPTVSYYPGQYVNVVFQQNLNHWFPEKPGYFDLAISYNAVTQPQNATWTTIAGPMTDFPAHDMVWQTNFTFSAKMPHTPCQHCVLRARYVSHNPDEIDPANNTDAIFYNCADIAIGGAAPKKPMPAAKPRSTLAHLRQVPAPTPKTCCTPTQWKAYGTDGSTLLKIWYSWANSLQPLVRIDRLYSDMTTLSTISNYTDPTNVPEYVSFNVSTCETYGGDAFYPWCYGAPANDLVFENATISVWSNKAYGGDMVWVTDANCAPLMWEQEGHAPFTFDVVATTVPPSVFTPPASCDAAIGRGCGPKRAK